MSNQTVRIHACRPGSAAVFQQPIGAKKSYNPRLLTTTPLIEDRLFFHITHSLHSLGLLVIFLRMLSSLTVRPFYFILFQFLWRWLSDCGGLLIKLPRWCYIGMPCIGPDGTVGGRRIAEIPKTRRSVRSRESGSTMAGSSKTRVCERETLSSER